MLTPRIPLLGSAVAVLTVSGRAAPGGATLAAGTTR